MGWWEDWRDVGLNVLTMGFYGIAKGTGAVPPAINSATTQMEASLEYLLQGLGKALQQGDGHLGSAGQEGKPDDRGLGKYPGLLGGRTPQGHPVAVAPPPPHSLVESSACCCERFEFNNGLLLDKMTGRLWEYDTNARALVAIPMKPAPEHEQIVSLLMEHDISRIGEAYAQEVVGQLPQKVRAAAIKEFDQQYLEPLRSLSRFTKSESSGNPPG